MVKTEFKYNWHNAKNSYHSLLFTNAVSSSGASFFLRRVGLVDGVLLSLKSLVCLPSSKVYFVCGVAWLVRLLGLWGCLACGEVILLSLAFSVSIK